MQTNANIYFNIARRLFVILVAVAGAVRLIVGFTQSGRETWQIVLALVVVLLGIIAGYFDVTESLSERPRLSVKHSDQTRINEYMFNLLRHGGRVLIFSNDLTWVRESQKIQKLLAVKAAHDEVTLILPKENEIMDSLRAKGARTYTYPEHGLVPKSRFTIVYYGTADQKVAVGRRRSGLHVINEYGSTDLTFALAQDLVDIVMGLPQRG